ncbi:MAG: hypothetical protein M1818_007323 [Claussenomyces sp. TS43310]|nr:MAG: hypothetical protein M1818_007323 [Claussenomyces sp. TS43310]
MSDPQETMLLEPLPLSEMPTFSQQTHSSPTRSATYTLNGRKEKRPPSITPRKFTRFFTPRSHESRRSGASRRALFDITRPANNRNGVQSSPLRPFSSISGQENDVAGFSRDTKRRKCRHTRSSTPEDLSPVKAVSQGTSCILEDSVSEDDASCAGSPLTVASNIDPRSSQVWTNGLAARRRIERLEDRGVAGQLVQLSLGSQTLSRRQRSIYPVAGWENETGAFYSRPEDRQVVTSVENPNDPCIPFCTTSCNSNSLIAIGDEEGRVRLVESQKNGTPAFKDYYLAFRPHTNAIIHMSFSQDDTLLATASGDQTASVIDMFTQQTISILAAHSASVKQVKFQPGRANNSIVASSARDGNVHIWDLRCKGSEGPVMTCIVPLDPIAEISPRPKKEINHGVPVGTITNVHRPALEGRMHSIVGPSPASRAEPLGRSGNVSVTALTFLPEGNEHLLLTASEANASVKLWDIRALGATRRKNATAAVSVTALPNGHSTFRHFGISAMELNGDASRLYTVCKDNTVYAYSTPHLIIGSAPEMSATRASRRHQVECKDGLGPLYGFRHSQFLATSFYVKCAIRPAKYGKAEMLAVGSSNGCAILFPTDEKYLSQKPWQPEVKSPIFSVRHPQITRTASNVSNTDRADDKMHISENGTPLIRGHDREVGDLSWTSNGDLVTLGDDYIVRCWREGDDARDLRTGGEDEGRRWGCGWADVDPKLDIGDDVLSDQ